jgi:transposase
MYEKFEAEIEKLNQRVEEQAGKRPGARLLMTHPGVGPITALATEVFLGDPARFADSKALASYVGMIPREYSSGGRQRLGGLSKQGNPLLRFLWGEAGAHAARKDPPRNSDRDQIGMPNRLHRNPHQLFQNRIRPLATIEFIT